MESRDYQELAPKTSSGAREAQSIVNRVGDDYHLLAYAMDELVNASIRLEQVKKMLFYGKSDEGLRVATASAVELMAKAENRPFRFEATRSRLEEDLELLHGAIGLATEAGEFLLQVSNCIFFGGRKDPTNRLEELGDLSWYLALAAKANGTPFEQIWAANIAKLRKRYPDGEFDARFASDRNVADERRAIDSVRLDDHEVVEFWAEEIKVGDRVRSLKPGSEGEVIEGTVVFVGPDLLRLDPRTIKGLKAPESEGESFEFMLSPAYPWRIVDRTHVIGDFEPKTAAMVRAQWALMDKIAGWPGITWIGDGYALFDVEHFPLPTDLPEQFYWVDYFRLPDDLHARAKDKMKDKVRYHVGHLPTAPGPKLSLPGTPKVCTCAMCMPRQEAE